MTQHTKSEGERYKVVLVSMEYLAERYDLDLYLYSDWVIGGGDNVCLTTKRTVIEGVRNEV